ncbi:hypothetical protein B0H19DRAFT_1085296 [Mycena capillaripes]|nr:hypothetical protein B0H19DRAFT_1085296 [Mycena capillaripes]
MPTTSSQPSAPRIWPLKTRYKGCYREGRSRGDADTTAPWKIWSHPLLEFLVPRKLSQQTLVIVGEVDGSLWSHLTVVDQIYGVNDAMALLEETVHDVNRMSRKVREITKPAACKQLLPSAKRGAARRSRSCGFVPNEGGSLPTKWLLELRSFPSDLDPDPGPDVNSHLSGFFAERGRAAAIRIIRV